MEQLREQIRKEIKSLMEAKYPAPPEIMNALRNNLRLRPVIRYVNNLKAVNSIPPSYRVFLHNGMSFDLIIEEMSMVAKIGTKSYWLMNGDEKAEAIKELNRLLTQPIPSSGEEDTGDQAGDTGGDTGGGDTGGDDTQMEPPADEPAEEEPTA